MSSLQQTRYEFQASAASAQEIVRTSRSISQVATDFSSQMVNSRAQTTGGGPLSIALIGPAAVGQLAPIDAGDDEVTDAASPT